MPGRNVRHRQIAVPRTVPPVELDDLREAQIGDQIRHMARNDDGRGGSPRTQIVLHDGAQRRPVQMIEVRMRHQHQIDSRQIAHSNPGTPQPLQHKQPAREVRIDHHALPADLHEEAGMANERDPQFAVGDETRFVRLSAQRSHGGMPHQSPELRRTLAEGRIAKRCLDHPELACVLDESWKWLGLF